jgi:hypothetical protein
VTSGGRKSSVIKFHIGEHDKEDEWDDDDQETDFISLFIAF